MIKPLFPFKMKPTPVLAFFGAYCTLASLKMEVMMWLLIIGASVGWLYFAKKYANLSVKSILTTKFNTVYDKTKN